jgi:hypothetical protein
MLVHWQNREDGVQHAPSPAILYTPASHNAPRAPNRCYASHGGLQEGPQRPELTPPLARSQFIADAITKYENTVFESALAARFPHLALRALPEPKPPNCINSPEFAAGWTAKEDEEFDQ